MKDWLDEEMEREGLINRRSEYARMREQNAARSAVEDRLQFNWKTMDAKELRLTHNRDCDARALQEEHAKAHARQNAEAEKIRNRAKIPPATRVIVIGSIIIFYAVFVLIVEMFF